MKLNSDLNQEMMDRELEYKSVNYHCWEDHEAQNYQT